MGSNKILSSLNKVLLYTPPLFFLMCKYTLLPSPTLTRLRLYAIMVQKYRRRKEYGDMETKYRANVINCQCVYDKMRTGYRDKKSGKVVEYNLKNDSVLIELLKTLCELYNIEIHSELVKDYHEESEKQIREYVRYIILNILPVLDSKINNFANAISSIDKMSASTRNSSDNKSKRETLFATFSQYCDLKDDFMALASFRSYKHYCMYMESVFNFTLWSDTQDCESGYFFFANKMVLDNDVNFMERQLPTGYGKTIGNCFLISFILGYNVDSDVLYVCGNDKFTEDVFNNVQKLMKSDKYAKVFRYYEQFSEDKESIFSISQLKQLKFTISGSKKATNMRIITKLSDTNGVRAMWLFLDDITQRSDMAVLSKHEKDIHSFTHEWFERNYSRNNFRIVASGTTYSIFDILSHLKNKFNYENAQVSKVNKYTKISYADFISPNKIACFVCVPLLDPVTDESTYPKKISTFVARKKREDSYEEYMAMDNQTPLPPADNPFYYAQLREYTTTPNVGENGRTECCNASLDPKRFGKDYVSMPILAETNEGHYLIDWLYDNRPMEDLLNEVVAKIIRHNITKLVVEKNTDEGIAKQLSDMLYERGYTSCKIDTIYSTTQKDIRISQSEADIKNSIIFPKFGLYARSSPMGKALESVYTYSYNVKNEHDDAIDSLSIYAKHYIHKNNAQFAKLVTFRR